MNFSTLPSKNSKKNSSQNQVMLTPLKGNARRDSVEIIGEDMMTPLAVRRQRISSTPSQAVLTKFKRPMYNKERRSKSSRTIMASSTNQKPANQPKSSLMGITHRACVNRLRKEDIQVEELEWEKFHIAIFESILVFFEGSDCRFESRIEMKNIKSIKRIRINKKVGLMLVLQNKPVSMILRFRNREIRQLWYQNLRNKSSKGIRASCRSEKSFNLTNLNVSGTAFEEDDDDDVFEDITEDMPATPLKKSAQSGPVLPRVRALSCPNEEKIDLEHKPTFQSLRKNKKGRKNSRSESGIKSKRTLFDSIKQKANKIKVKLMK